MNSRISPLTALDVRRAQSTMFVGGAPGLQLVVSPGGTKSWRLYYRLPGSSRRRSMTLGRYPGLSLAEARKSAHQKLQEAADGADPKSARVEKAARAEVTVGDVVSKYLTWCAANNAAKTVESKTSAFRVHVLPAFKDLPLIDFGRRDAVQILDDASNRPAMRRQLHLYLSHFFSWCLTRDLIGSNPLAGLRPPRASPSRDRVLSDDEICALWADDSVTATIGKLSLLTAQRVGAIGALRWDDIDFRRAECVFPATVMKSGELHIVSLSPLAVAILNRFPRLPGPFVFGVGTGGAKPFSGASQGMRRLRARLGDPDWRLHDLRRTAVTLAQRAGCPLDAVRALTQHKPKGVIGVYARHAFAAEKRDVARAIGEEVARILEHDSNDPACSAEPAETPAQ